MTALPKGPNVNIDYAQEFEMRMAAAASNVPYHVFVTLSLEERAAIMAFRRAKGDVESILADAAKGK